MKVILYMAISANGMIARKNDKTDWSEAESNFYIAKVKDCGNMIIGKRTYEIMQRDDNKDADTDVLGNPQIVVLSSKQETGNKSGVEFVKSPSEAISFLEKKGFKTAMVAGGSQVDTAFIKADIVDEIYLDVESILFGEGIPLFSPSEFEIQLELMETTRISENGVQLHYKVK